MSNREYTVYLHHILDECHYIMSVIPEDDRMDEFLQDPTNWRAIRCSIQVIGEASKNIPGDIKYKWRNIEWKKMAGIRDVIAHDYARLDPSILASVCQKNIPSLIPQIEAILNEEQTND